MKRQWVDFFDELIHFFVLLFDTQMLVFLPGPFWFYVDMILVKVDLLQSGYITNYLFLKNEIKVSFIFFWFWIDSFFCLIVWYSNVSLFIWHFLILCWYDVSEGWFNNLVPPPIICFLSLFHFFFIFFSLHFFVSLSYACFCIWFFSNNSYCFYVFCA